MDSKRFCVVAVAALTFVVAAVAAGLPALAQPPAPVPRYFALQVGDDAPPPPDLKAPESKLLVMQAYTQAMPLLTFASKSPSHANETWYFGAEVRANELVDGGEVAHVTDHGVEKYRLFWLGEVPPVGAIAWTGPEGAAEFDPTPIFVRPASGSEADGSNLFWVDVAPTRPSTASVWYFGVGWFTK